MRDQPRTLTMFPLSEERGLTLQLRRRELVNLFEEMGE
jgi:hypothetical protein